VTSLVDPKVGFDESEPTVNVAKAKTTPVIVVTGSPLDKLTQTPVSSLLNVQFPESTATTVVVASRSRGPETEYLYPEADST